MTDLERLWDELPTGPAPTDAILRAARRADMVQQAATDDAAVQQAQEVRRSRRRLLGRPLIAAGAVTGLAAAVLVGANLGGGGGTGTGSAGQPQPAAFQADLKPAKSCEDLLDSYVQRGLRLVTAWGWQRPPIFEAQLRGLRVPGDSGYLSSGGALPRGGQLQGYVDRLGKDLTAGTAAKTVRQNSSGTGTNVQEAGVDEPDTVKTDGKVLAQLHDDELWLYSVRGKHVRRLSSLPIDDVTDGQLLLSGHTLVVLGKPYDGDATVDAKDTSGSAGGDTTTRVVTIDISDPRQPKQTHEVDYHGTVLAARQHGSAIRLVLDAGLPDLDFVTPGRDLSTAEAKKKNQQLVRDSKIGDWIPSYTADGGKSHQLIDCTDIAVPGPKVGLDTVGIVGFDADAPTELSTIGLAGSTDISYESADNLYLVASPPTYDGGVRCFGRCPLAVVDLKRPYGSTTGGSSYIFDFALNGDRAVHIASGEVEGRIQDRWAMDEVGGVLRVAVSPTDQTGDFNSVITLRKLGEDLVQDGRIDHLGEGEDIESVRWFDDLAIVVTYRQVDPMYAIDLSRPAHPTLLGRLRLPGFSSYLHPLGARRMIGVGTGPGGNSQVGLFDTSHLRHLRRIDAVHFRGTSPLAASDPRAFTWVQQSRTALTVLEHWGRSRVGYLATLAVRRGRLITTLSEVEYGDDVAQVRAVPLGDGRVVLVTGETARFLNLALR